MLRLSTYPYHCKETPLSDREVEVVVELVPRNDRERMRYHVIGSMHSDGYDLLDFHKRTFGDLVFTFRKNRNVDWFKYYALREQWYERQAKAIVEHNPQISFESALAFLHHPYFGSEPPAELLMECTTDIDRPAAPTPPPAPRS